jgi:hypothetical protein
MPVRIKILRYVWETGWSGARSVPPWPDPVFTEIFRAGNGWSVRDFWLGCVDLDFDIAPWGILYGQSHEALRGDREGIAAVCRRQATVDGVALTGYDHVVMFVHEPPADTGTCGADAVLDQGAVLLEHYHRQIGQLLGIGHVSSDPCVMGPLSTVTPTVAVLPGIELWHGDRRLCSACVNEFRTLRRLP